MTPERQPDMGTEPDNWDGPPTEAILPTSDAPISPVDSEPSFYDSLYRDEEPTAHPHHDSAPASLFATPSSATSPSTGVQPAAASEPVRSTRSSHSRGSKILIGVATTLTVLALALMAGIFLMSMNEPSAAPQAPPTTATLSPSAIPSAEASTSEGEAAAPPVITTPTPTPSATRDQTVFPADAEECPVVQHASGPVERSAAGSEATSCEFAEAVRAAYAEQANGDGPVTIQAYSPVTNQSYEMTCEGDSPVICRGGNEAVVYLG